MKNFSYLCTRKQETTTMAREKVYFEKRKDALNRCKEKEQQCGYGIYKVWKMKWGKHKGMYFVGTDFQWLNISY